MIVDMYEGEFIIEIFFVYFDILICIEKFF